MIYICMQPQSDNNDFFLKMYSNDPVQLKSIDTHISMDKDFIGIGGSSLRYKSGYVEEEITIITHDVSYCDKDTFLQIVNNKHNLQMFRMS